MKARGARPFTNRGPSDHHPLVAVPHCCYGPQMAPGDLRLPPVDKYRLPFIEPLGHLVLNAARADNALINLVAAVSNTSPSAVAHTLRNWGPETRAWVLQAINRVDDADDDLADQAKALVATFHELRERRHRAVHDAVEVGIFGGPEGGYEVRPLHEGYVRSGKTTAYRLEPVTPKALAALAYELHDLAALLEAVEARLTS